MGSFRQIDWTKVRDSLAGPRLHLVAFMIRHAEPADLPAITDIYNEAGVATTASYDLAPVSVEQRAEWFAALGARNYPVLVLESEQMVVGYASYGAYRDRAGYDHTVEHSIYLKREFRSNGGGKALMGELIRLAKEADLHVMLGLVDAENEASLSFHRGLGFEEVARMPEVGRKFGRWLDLVIVELVL